MRTLLLVPLLGLCSTTPQDLDPEIVSGIFGDLPRAGASGYGVQDDGNAKNTNNPSAGTINAVVQIVKDTPADYVEETSSYTEGINKAVVEVNTDFKNCAEYTESLGYECVPYYQCSNGSIITDGEGLIDVRGGFGNLNPTDSKCPGFLDVCCKDPNFIPPPPPRIIYQPKCGRRNDAGVGARIQGFTEGESQFGEWPHMCAVLHDKLSLTGESTNLYKCGGSLIAPGVLITAAHCIKDFVNSPTSLKIRCGEWDTQKQSEPYKHQDRIGKIVKIHPEFDPRNLANDFALVFLNQDFILDYHIDTVCLPQPNEQYDGQVCYATGWGKDKFGADGVYQVVLKEVDLRVVNKIECQDKLRLTRLGKKFQLHDSFMCAGGSKGKDTCKGDGGSPLVCSRKSDPNTYDQAGIVAWGIGCGQDGTPGVYADVSKAVCWIDYAMTCQFGKTTGDFNSYFGNTRQACGAWFDAKLNSLNGIEKLRQQYQECQVNWLNPGKEAINQGGEGSYVDLQNFERGGGSYSGANTADVVKAADGYVDPTKSSDGGYVDPAKSAEGYVDPTKSAEGYVDPTKSADSYVDPTKSAGSY